jgi:hypothetical protein
MNGDKLERLADELFAGRNSQDEVALDALAEHVAPWNLSTDELDLLLTKLEAKGCEVVVGDQPKLVEELKLVMPAVKRFMQRENRKPTVSELAAEAECEPLVVWRALRYGQVIGR